MAFTQLLSISFAGDGTLLKSMPDFLAPLPFPSFSSAKLRKRRIGHAAVATSAVPTLTRAQEMDETIYREFLLYVQLLLNYSYLDYNALILLPQ